MNATVKILQQNVLLIIATIVFAILYTTLTVKVNTWHENRVTHLNTWIISLNANDTNLVKRKISQTKWLENRQVIFDTYLKAENQ